MKSSRLAAFELVYGVIQNGAYSNLSIDSALNSVERNDKRFMTTLALGIIERKLTLDYIINKFTECKLKPKVKILLYLGVYQLYFMDSVPSRVAVNETVELAKSVGCQYYTGMINAVLHKIDSERIDIEDTDDLSVKYSCPEELINMWTKHYGQDNTLKILESINGSAPVFAVPNTLFVDEDELCYELMCDGIECEVKDGVVAITSASDLSATKAYKNGLFHIEDLSSYNCAKALGAECGQTVIDVCSAPGGKAFTVAELMNNQGKVIACDIHNHRVDLIRQGAERLCLSCIEPVINNAEKFNPSFEKADRVLCDVPCSGFGIIRRKPEIRYKSLDSVKELPELQYKILSVSSRYLKAGGRIIYSTCTLNKKENEKVVERFLNDNKHFKLIEMNTAFPSKDGGDGFFYALMELSND